MIVPTKRLSGRLTMARAATTEPNRELPPFARAGSGGILGRAPRETKLAARSRVTLGPRALSPTINASIAEAVSRTRSRRSLWTTRCAADERISIPGSISKPHIHAPSSGPLDQSGGYGEACRRLRADAMRKPPLSGDTVPHRLGQSGGNVAGSRRLLHRRSLVGVAADRALLGEELLERLAPADLRMRLGQDPGGL